jgi:hypothetical protein
MKFEILLNDEIMVDIEAHTGEEFYTEESSVAWDVLGGETADENGDAVVMTLEEAKKAVETYNKEAIKQITGFILRDSEDRAREAECMLADCA